MGYINYAKAKEACIKYKSFFEERDIPVISKDRPYYWEKYGLTIVGDGYLIDGTRVYLVKERTDHLLTELDNALVFSVAEHEGGSDL